MHYCTVPQRHLLKQQELIQGHIMLTQTILLTSVSAYSVSEVVLYLVTLITGTAVLQDTLEGCFSGDTCGDELSTTSALREKNAELLLSSILLLSIPNVSSMNIIMISFCLNQIDRICSHHLC